MPVTRFVGDQLPERLVELGSSSFPRPQRRFQISSGAHSAQLTFSRCGATYGLGYRINVFLFCPENVAFPTTRNVGVADDTGSKDWHTGGYILEKLHGAGHPKLRSIGKRE